MKKFLAAYCLGGKEMDFTQTDAKKLTHLLLAFGKIEKGKISTGCFADAGKIRNIKLYNPEMKVLLSLTGDQDSFSMGSATEAGRLKIAQSCARVVQKLDLDGIDLHWIYPCCPVYGLVTSPTDKKNFTMLCETIRRELNNIGAKYYQLTIAAGAGQYYIESTEMDKVQGYLDYIFLMTYDLRCEFHTLTGHHTNLFTAIGDLNRTSVDEAFRSFRHAGVPSEKIVIGAASHSIQWDNVKNINHGFLQLTTGAGHYGPNYHDLAANYINQNGFIRYWDKESKAPYLFDGKTFISYDDPESIGCKCEYILQKECAGIFLWQYGGDHTRNLLNTMADCLYKKH